ncbi:hypothetical protein RhiirC2_785683, partial [Rhizophagus irregularis]
MPRIDYKAQLNIWNKVQCDQINRIGRAMFKKKCAVVSTMPNCLIYSSFGYKIKDMYVLQLQRQFTRLRNQMNATGIVNTVLWIHGNRMLRYKDLKNRFNISTKGRISTWFKQLETIFITDRKLSSKVKNEFIIGRHYQFISPSIENVNVKSRDWIATYTTITDEAVIARIIDIKHDSLIAEHWIQDANKEISPSVQLPVIKKCNGCDLKSFHTRSPRSSVKKRCLFKVNKQTTIKVKASSI